MDRVDAKPPQLRRPVRSGPWKSQAQRPHRCLPLTAGSGTFLPQTCGRRHRPPGETMNFKMTFKKPFTARSSRATAMKLCRVRPDLKHFHAPLTCAGLLKLRSAKGDSVASTAWSIMLREAVCELSRLSSELQTQAT